MQDPEAMYGLSWRVKLLCNEQFVCASQFVEELVKALAAVAKECHVFQLSDAIVMIRLFHVNATQTYWHMRALYWANLFVGSIFPL